jgi:hypothetical protein
MRWPDLRRGLTVGTGQTHRIVIERVPVHRLEIEDGYFNPASAVVLPDVPVQQPGGMAQAVAFSADDLWTKLLTSHEKFAKNFREQAFDPEAGSEGADRRPGLGNFIAALGFQEQNANHRLLITAHTDCSGDGADNQRLSEARARSVLAVLENDRAGFVRSCHDFHADDDDAIILRYMAHEHGWPCDPGAGDCAPAEAIEAFQNAYNERFSRSITVDGVVGDETHGAYFDVYQEELAAMADSQAGLGALRAKLRFARAQRKTLACGERYPQEHSRVELLFFEPPAIPDPNDERTPDLLYKRNLFRFEAIDPGAWQHPSATEPGAGAAPVAIADAPAPPPGVGDPDEPLETQMASGADGDGTDLWAFLEPLDAARTAVGSDDAGIAT